MAHERCNNRKRDFLAAAEHVARWRGRLDAEGHPAPELVDIARDVRWETAPVRRLNVTRAIYLRLPADVRLWRLGEGFVEAEPAELRAALGTAPGSTPCFGWPTGWISVWASCWPADIEAHGRPRR